MLVILENSSQLIRFCCEKESFSQKTLHFKNALQCEDFVRKRRLAVLNRRFLKRLRHGVESSLSRARRVDAIISRAQISVNAHALIKDGTVSFSVTIAFLTRKNASIGSAL